MSSRRIVLIRHGQASVEAADYDQLSPLGSAQCAALGRYLRAQGVHWQHAVCGPLRRHQQSLQALTEAAGWQGHTRIEAGFEEYDFRAVLQTYASGVTDPALRAALTQGGKAWLPHLRGALEAWGGDRLALPDTQRYPVFVQRVLEAMASLRRHEAGDGPVLVMTSGGVKGALVGRALGLSASAAMRLKLVIENSAVTELDVDGADLHLVRFNSVAHLQDASQRSMV